MKKCQVLKIDVFTDIPGQGNPAGIVLDGDIYTEKEMQEIASKTGFNETVFVCSSSQADWRFRFFMPLKETDLCGHGTMGAIFALVKEVYEDKQFLIETQVGVLEVEYKYQTKEIVMSQQVGEFKAFQGSLVDLCEVINIEQTDLDDALPIVYGSTGLWTLLLPVKSSEVLDKMIPKTSQFKQVLTEMPEASIHPFVITSEDNKICHARHFSSSFSGSVEDSVTGTASGAMGAYLLNYLYKEESDIDLTVYQGKQMNQEGKVSVHASDKEVNISGTAVLNSVFDISI